MCCRQQGFSVHSGSVSGVCREHRVVREQGCCEQGFSEQGFRAGTSRTSRLQRRVVLIEAATLFYATVIAYNLTCGSPRRAVLIQTTIVAPRELHGILHSGWHGVERNDDTSSAIPLFIQSCRLPIFQCCESGGWDRIVLELDASWQCAPAAGETA